MVEGDSNRVETRTDNDSVRDLGSGNRMSISTRETGRDAERISDRPFESKFVDADGVRLHYLDFGGEGLPVVFVHSEGWDARTYAEFAPRYTDANRMLAVTRRYQQEAVRPALVAGQERFRRAFNQIRIVPLDVSTIYGYEYRDSPGAD